MKSFYTRTILMRKSTMVSTGIIMVLLGSNIVTGMNYVIDSNHYEREILYQTKVSKYSEIRNEKLEQVVKQKESDIDDLNKSIQQQSTEIHTLKQQLENATKRNESPMRQLNMTATAYIPNCNGCSGITYSGFNVKNTIEYEGRKIIAADFNKIPLYSIVRIDTDTESFEAIVLDTGGAIRGSNTIDLLVNSYESAIQFGRQEVLITVLREGKG
jgi:3D (Asp-Asp-Asp) domain-containing protein